MLKQNDVPTAFEDYRLLEPLGRGGMGTVFLADDVVLDRRVAIKFLNPKILERRGAKERFLIEARAAARVQHPHVAAVYRAAEVDGHPYLVSEFVPGRSLDRLERPIPWPDIERMGRALAEGLGAAHERGVLHRDIKPANAILAEDGQLKIIDFGIAKLLEHEEEPNRPVGYESAGSSPRLTEEGRVMGTPHYLAPELWMGQPASVRTDIYALGILLFELAAGRVPRAELTGADLAEEAMFREPPSLEEVIGTIPDGAVHTADVIQRCLRLHPHNRPESAYAVASALGGYATRAVSDVSVSAKVLAQDLAVERANPWSDGLALMSTRTSSDRPTLRRIARGTRDWRRFLGVAGLLALPFVCRPTERPENLASTLLATNVQRVTAFEGCESDPSFDPLTGGLLYEGAHGKGYAVFLDRRDGSPRQQVTSGLGWEGAPAPSPSGHHLAFMRRHEGEPSTYVFDRRDSGAPVRIASGRTRPAWSPDGRYLWAGKETAPSRYDATRGQAVLQLAAPPGTILLRIRERADGSVWALAQGDGAGAEGIGLLAYAPGKRSGTWRWRGRAREMLTTFPNGDALIVERSASGASQLLRVPFDPQASITVLAAGPVMPEGGAAFSPGRDRITWSDCSVEENLVWFDSDGSGFREGDSSKARWFENEPTAVPKRGTIVLVSDRSGKEQIWEIDPGDPRKARMIPTPDLAPNAVAVSKDGALLAFSVNGEGLFVISRDARQGPRQVTFGSSDDYPVFFNDDRSLLFHTELSDHGARVGRVSIEGGPVEVIWDQPSSEPAVSPDGRTIAFVLETDAERELGIPVLYDGVRTPRPVSAALRPGWYHNLRFSSDGERLLLLEEGRSMMEISLKEGEVLRQYKTTTAQFHGLTYYEDRILTSRVRWSGDVWLADLTGERYLATR